MDRNITIKEATVADFREVMEIEKLAFNSDIEAGLVADLLEDKSAKPFLSLLAIYEGEAVGHILFTKVIVEKQPEVMAHILAPLAVVPQAQKQGIGGLLIKKGLEILTERGTNLVFVLGHTAYYPKYGFINNAGKLGFQAPYPIPEIHADAWMIKELKVGAIGKHHGKIKCADKLMKPEYWSE